MSSVTVMLGTQAFPVCNLDPRRHQTWARCMHCAYAHASTACPLLYCRHCAAYGHSAVVCPKIGFQTEK